MGNPESVINCHSCGAEISVEDTRCPNCDSRVTTKPWGIGLAVFGLLIGVVFFYGNFSGLISRNWQAGVAAGIFISLMGARLYWIRRKNLANASPPSEDLNNT